MATQDAAASAKHWRRRERGVTAGLLSAPMLWLLLFFVAPVLYVASYSVGAIELFPTDTGVISLDDWRRFLGGGSIYLGLFWKSVRMSLTVSVVVVLLAYPIGYFLALCVRKLKYVLLLVIIVPFLTSFLLRVLAWKVMLGDRGVVNSRWSRSTSCPRSADRVAALQPVHRDAGPCLRVDPVRRAADLREPEQPRSQPARGGERSRRQPSADVPPGPSR